MTHHLHSLKIASALSLEHGVAIVRRGAMVRVASMRVSWRRWAN